MDMFPLRGNSETVFFFDLLEFKGLVVQIAFSLVFLCVCGCMSQDNVGCRPFGGRISP